MHGVPLTTQGDFRADPEFLCDCPAECSGFSSHLICRRQAAAAIQPIRLSFLPI